ncbi:hypothetical protein CTZ27_30595 [Streptomyces griseocarneus]|nr:hypothetical protein CTZ27_30595 [Streptomyces griseocarneus]
MTFGAQQTAPGRPPHKSRARKLLPLGVALWVVLEIWLLTLVAGAAGGFTVFLLLAAGVVVGSYVIKRAGRRAWKRLTAQLQSGDTAAEPAPEGGGNGLTMLGGLLIILPGLLSDVVGLLCLFPLTRGVLRKGLERWLVRQPAAPGAFGPLGDAFQQARMRMPDGKVVQGEVIREDAPPSAPREGGPQLPR